jgi:glutaredoxin
VEVLTNPSCPHCLHILDEVTDMAVAARVPIAAVDLLHHPEVAEARGFEHSPVVVCGERAIPGMPTPEEFAALVADAMPSHRNA